MFAPLGETGTIYHLLFHFFLFSNHSVMTLANRTVTHVHAKPHYEQLDGLRGVAALLVVIYHIFEGYAFAGNLPVITCLNHGYLAVDFFFILSGFVIGYAYDDRWKQGLTLSGFFKRRLIRLHPMVVVGALLGVTTFLLQGACHWDGTKVPLSWTLVALFFAMCLLPAVPGCPREVRGNGEMFPLNGPAWSLFFEYIGNILYALFIRKLGTRMLGTLTLLLGAGWLTFALSDASGYGSMRVGWTLDAPNAVGGLLRMLFPFTLGLWLSRKFVPLAVKHTFWPCALVLLLLFLVPYIHGKAPVCLNSIYEAFCVMLVFPCLLWLGASGSACSEAPASPSVLSSAAASRFLGNLSYPLYMVHYPIMYLYYAWLIRHGIGSSVTHIALAVGVVVGCVLLAWCCLRFIETPVRRWLSRKFV